MLIALIYYIDRIMTWWWKTGHYHTDNIAYYYARHTMLQKFPSNATQCVVYQYATLEWVSNATGNRLSLTSTRVVPLHLFQYSPPTLRFRHQLYICTHLYFHFQPARITRGIIEISVTVLPHKNGLDSSSWEQMTEEAPRCHYCWRQIIRYRVDDKHDATRLEYSRCRTRHAKSHGFDASEASVIWSYV